MTITILHENGALPQVYSERVLLSTVLRDADAASSHTHAHPMCVAMPCGGNGTCGKCRVYASGVLSAPSEQEKVLLGDALSAGERLACMTWAEGDCTIELHTRKEQVILTDGVLPALPLNPAEEGAVGMAVDIGTTTVAVYAYHLKDGSSLGRHSFQNPQAKFGADVISRIQAALDGNAAALRQCIRKELDSAFRRLAKHAGTPLEQVRSICVTGNTTMLDLFSGVDVEPLSHSPFEVSEHFGTIHAESQFPALFRAQVYLPRTISAFVGSDITCALLSSGMVGSAQTILLADIGTNGEMALWHNGRLWCCSTAAGPAFEGAGISMGSAAITGAMSHVETRNGQLHWDTVGGGNAFSICGSGLIDAVAALLELGLVDETGRIDEDAPLYEAYGCEREDGPALRLGDSGIILTQPDIRAVQLAKSAICAGMYTLLHEAGASVGQVGSLLLAGGFGSFLSCASAGRIGLIPSALAPAARSIGNAAGMGASMILLSDEMKARSLEIAAAAKDVELSASPYFMEQYVEQMMFS